MEFRQLEAFVNVAKYRSFSRAADATFLTQPTISTHINNLEKELGAVLLNRVGREVTLTSQGQLFYPYAIDLLNTRSQALLSVQKSTEELKGVLDIHTSSIPGQYYLPELLSVFHEKHSKVRFSVDQSDSKQVIQNLLSQKGEIGFTGFRQNNCLVYEPVFIDEMVLLVADNKRFSPWETGSTIEFEEISHENFILREEGSGTKQEMERAEISGVSVFKEVRVVARMNSLEAIKEAVAGGLGISVLSKKAVQDSLTTLPVKYLYIKGLEKKRIFYMVYNKSSCLSPVAAAFWQAVLEYRGQNGDLEKLSLVGNGEQTQELVLV